MPAFGERIYFFCGNYGVLAGEILYAPTEDDVKQRIRGPEVCDIIHPHPKRPGDPRERWTRALRCQHGIKRGGWCYPDEFLKFEKENLAESLILRKPEPRAAELEEKPLVEPVPPPPSPEQLGNLAAPEPEKPLTNVAGESSEYPHVVVKEPKGDDHFAYLVTSPAPDDEKEKHESAPAPIDTGRPQPKYASVKRGNKVMPKVKLSNVRPSDEVLKTY